jgi:hypothetical protein
MSRTRLVAVVLTVVTLAASGCGGSSKTGSTGASTGAALTSTTATSTAKAATTKATSRRPMTRAELTLIARAGAICKRINARHALLKLPTPQAIAREIPLFASYQQAALAELLKLTPPASMAHEWKQFAAVAKTLARDTTRLGDYAKANHVAIAGTRLLPGIDKDERHISALAKRAAITGCEQVY